MDLNNFDFKIYEDRSLILHREAEEIVPDSFRDGTENGKFLGKMYAFMRVHGGIGLAAPQIGLGYKFFIMKTPDHAPWVCINPKVLSSSEVKGMHNEGCLSYPGLRLTLSRPLEVLVEYYDQQGQLITEVIRDLPARIFQHELDHVNGIVFTELASPTKLKLAKSKIKRNLKRMKKTGRI